jgi:hypothetical protein
VILMVDHRSILLFPFATVFVPRLSLNYYLICGNRICLINSYRYYDENDTSLKDSTAGNALPNGDCGIIP